VATAMMAPAVSDWEEKIVETPVQEEFITGSGRLLRDHRRAFETEIEQATSLMIRRRKDTEEETYSQETLDRAIKFLKNHFSYAWNACSSVAPIPCIGPGPDRSIDLYWKQSSWKLLVNIPADEHAEGAFYGDDYGRNKTEGSFDPNDLSRTIIAWMIA